MAASQGLEARREVIQPVAALLAACGHFAQHPFHEPNPFHAVCAPADPTPHHRVPLGTHRRSVPRWHPGMELA
jgi:hypothetical protein